MRKFFVAFSILAVLSMVVSACGTATPTTPVANTQAAGEPTNTTAPVALSGSVLLWIMPNGADPLAAINAELSAFYALNPGVQVSAEVVGWGDAYNNIQTAVQGGAGPCVTQMGTTWVGAFGSMDGVHEFTDAEIAEVGGVSNFLPAAWGSVVVGGKVVAIPWFGDVRAIMYRSDIFTAANVDPAVAFASIDNYVAALKTIRDSGVAGVNGDPIAPLVHPGKNDWNVWQNDVEWIWNYGGDLLNADNTASVFNSDAAIDAVTLYSSLYPQGLTAFDTLELNSSSTDGRFGEGNAAAILTGPWNISNLKNTVASGWEITAAQVAVAEFPKGSAGPFTFVGGSDLAIMNTCQNYAAAWALVKYLVTNESQIRYGNAIGMLPVTNAALLDPSFSNDPMFSVFIAAANHGKSAPAIAKWGPVETNLNTALQGLWEDVGAACPVPQGAAGYVAANCTAITRDQVKTALDNAAATVDGLLAG